MSVHLYDKILHGLDDLTYEHGQGYTVAAVTSAYTFNSGHAISDVAPYKYDTPARGFIQPQSDGSYAFRIANTYPISEAAALDIIDVFGPVTNIKYFLVYSNGTDGGGYPNEGQNPAVLVDLPTTYTIAAGSSLEFRLSTPLFTIHT